MRSLIIEGMDGSGKDTLIERLIKSYPDHRLHERASTSLGGPVPNLAEWVARDSVHLTKTSTPYIYNRHPLISEPIYGKYRLAVPPRPTDPIFTNASWLSAYRQIVSTVSIVIVCQPPLHTVSDTLRRQGADAHMPGVYDNQEMLYAEYATLVWPGRVIRYNYMADPYESLIRLINRALEN